jgi:hypothetical protein
MKKIPYFVELNVASIPTRSCRYYQEQVYEYLDDGRARFQWDRLRQDYLMNISDIALDICDNCSSNILLDFEGCKGQLYEFETFMKMLPEVKPDSILLQKRVLNALFDMDQTQTIIDEMEYLQEAGWNLFWPVAQVFVDDRPAIFEDSLKCNNLVYQEWSGDDEQIYYTSNDGYHIGLTRDGIVLKKNFGENIPQTFVSLTRKGLRVVGKTETGQMVPISVHRAQFPEWWSENPGVDSELRFTSLPISGIFQDIFNMLIIFSKTALKNLTGVSIFSQFYRRA